MNNDSNKLSFGEPDLTLLDIRPSDWDIIHYHSACLMLKDEIYIFGGRGSAGCISDFTIFDLTKNQIRSPQQVDSHIKRVVAGHCSWKFGDRMFVFGGESGFMSGYENDIFSCDINIKKWERHEVGGTWEIPCGREGHTINFLENRKEIFMFGGANEKKYFNSMFFLNMETFIWKRVHPRGLESSFIPSPRFYHCMETCQKTEIVHVIGGWIEKRERKKVDDSRLIYRFDLKLSRWIAPISFPDGYFPEGIASAKSAQMGEWMIIVGGWKPHQQKDLHRITAFNMITKEWKGGDDFDFKEGEETHKILEHPTITVVQNELVLIGGNPGSKEKNHNVHKLDLSFLLK